VLRDYTQATLETAAATGLSAEAIGGLYQRIIGVGAIADVSKLRAIGAGIKNIADQSMLSAQEVLDFTVSLEDLFRISSTGFGRSATDMTLDLQAIAGSLATFVKPDTIAGMFTGLQQELETVPGDVTRAFAYVMNRSIPEIQNMLKEGDVGGLMAGLIREIQGKTGIELRNVAKLWGDALGLSERELLRLRKFDLSTMNEQIAMQREEILKRNKAQDAALARQQRLTRAWNQAQDALAALWEEQGMKVVSILNKHLIPALDLLIVKIKEVRDWWNGLSDDVKKDYVIWGSAGLAVFGFSEKLLGLAGLFVSIGKGIASTGAWLLKFKGVAAIAGKALGALKIAGTGVLMFLRGAISLLTGPVGIVIGLITVISYWDEITAALRKWAPESWVKKWDKIVALFHDTFPYAATMFKAAWEGIKTFFGDLVGWFGKQFTAFSDLMMGGIRDIADGWGIIMRKLKSAWPKIKNFLLDAGEWILRNNPITGPLISAFENLWPSIKKALTSVGEKIESWLMGSKWFRKLTEWSDSVVSFFSGAAKIVAGADEPIRPGVPTEPEIKTGPTTVKVPQGSPVMVEAPKVEPVMAAAMPTPVKDQDVVGTPVVNIQPDENTGSMVTLMQQMVRQNEQQNELLRRMLAKPTGGGGTAGGANNGRRVSPMDAVLREGAGND